MATTAHSFESLNRKQALQRLRSEILSAQVTASLNEKLNRSTPENVAQLAAMKVPSRWDIEQAEAELQATGKEQTAAG